MRFTQFSQQMHNEIYPLVFFIRFHDICFMHQPIRSNPAMWRPINASQDSSKPPGAMVIALRPADDAECVHDHRLLDLLVQEVVLGHARAAVHLGRCDSSLAGQQGMQVQQAALASSSHSHCKANLRSLTRSPKNAVDTHMRESQMPLREG